VRTRVVWGDIYVFFHISRILKINQLKKELGAAKLKEPKIRFSLSPLTPVFMHSLRLTKVLGVYIAVTTILLGCSKPYSTAMSEENYTLEIPQASNFSDALASTSHLQEETRQVATQTSPPRSIQKTKKTTQKCSWMAERTRRF
jgi:hypothetical protein